MALATGKIQSLLCHKMSLSCLSTEDFLLEHALQDPLDVLQEAALFGPDAPMASTHEAGLALALDTLVQEEEGQEVHDEHVQQGDQWMQDVQEENEDQEKEEVKEEVKEQDEKHGKAWYERKELDPTRLQRAIRQVLPAQSDEQVLLLMKRACRKTRTVNGVLASIAAGLVPESLATWITIHQKESVPKAFDLLDAYWGHEHIARARAKYEAEMMHRRNRKSNPVVNAYLTKMLGRVDLQPRKQTGKRLS